MTILNLKAKQLVPGMRWYSEAVNTIVGTRPGVIYSLSKEGEGVADFVGEDTPVRVSMNWGSPIQILCNCNNGILVTEAAFRLEKHSDHCHAKQRDATLWPHEPEEESWWDWDRQTRCWRVVSLKRIGQIKQFTMEWNHDWSPIRWGGPQGEPQFYLDEPSKKYNDNWVNMFVNTLSTTCGVCHHDVRERIYYPLVGPGQPYHGCMC